MRILLLLFLLASTVASAQLSREQQLSILTKIQCQLEKGKKNFATRRLLEYAKNDNNYVKQYHASLLEDGVFLLRNVQRAKKIYRQSALAGHAPSAHSYASLLLRHNSTNQLLQEEALGFLVMSAKSGYLPAQFSLAYNYQHGINVEKSRKKALQWYKKSAYLGDRDSQYQLYRLYAAKQSTTSLAWLFISAENGQPLAVKSLNKLKFKGADLNRAQSRARIIQRALKPYNKQHNVQCVQL